MLTLILTLYARPLTGPIMGTPLVDGPADIWAGDFQFSKSYSFHRIFNKLFANLYGHKMEAKLDYLQILTRHFTVIPLCLYRKSEIFCLSSLNSIILKNIRYGMTLNSITCQKKSKGSFFFMTSIYFCPWPFSDLFCFNFSCCFVVVHVVQFMFKESKHFSRKVRGWFAFFNSTHLPLAN